MNRLNAKVRKFSPLEISASILSSKNPEISTTSGVDQGECITQCFSSQSWIKMRLKLQFEFRKKQSSGKYTNREQVDGIDWKEIRY